MRCSSESRPTEPSGKRYTLPRENARAASCTAGWPDGSVTDDRANGGGSAAAKETPLGGFPVAHEMREFVREGDRNLHQPPVFSVFIPG